MLFPKAVKDNFEVNFDSVVSRSLLAFETFGIKNCSKLKKKNLVCRLYVNLIKIKIKPNREIF